MKPKTMLNLIIILVAIMLVSACEPCQNKIIKKINSPDGKYTAVAFLRDAGATTDFSPQVSILRNGKELENKKGNIFIGNHSEFVDIKWESNSALLIAYNVREEDIFKKKTGKYGIEIKYMKKDADFK